MHNVIVLPFLCMLVNFYYVSARPYSGFILFIAVVYTGLKVISGDMIPKTILGSNQVSIFAFPDSTLGCLCLMICLLSLSVIVRRTLSVNPVPTLHIVQKTSLSASYVANNNAPYFPTLLPLPCRAPTTTKSTESVTSPEYSFFNFIHAHSLAPALY